MGWKSNLSCPPMRAHARVAGQVRLIEKEAAGGRGGEHASKHYMFPYSGLHWSPVV